MLIGKRMLDVKPAVLRPRSGLRCGLKPQTTKLFLLPHAWDSPKLHIGLPIYYPNSTQELKMGTQNGHPKKRDRKSLVTFELKSKNKRNLIF